MAWRLAARLRRNRGVSYAVYAAWLALLALTAPSWLPEVRVWHGEVDASGGIALLGYSYSGEILTLQLYRGYAWPLAPVEVRLQAPSGQLAYIRQRVPPSHTFTVNFYVKAPEVTVSILVGGRVVLRRTLELGG